MATIKTIQENEDELWKTYTPKMNEKIAESDAIYDNQKNTVSTLYDGKIQDTNQLYEDDLRANEVQKYINAREVAENNANLGLTDSGLNRTQQTAVQLSASNNAAKIQRQRQSAVDELTRLMTADLAEIEGNKSTAQMNIRSGYEDLVNKAAVAKYEADWDAETARIQEETKRIENYNKTLIEASNKATESKNTDYQFLLNEIAENKSDLEYCANLIAQFGKKHTLNVYDSEILSLLKRAEIKPSEFLHYGKTGTIYSTYDEDDLNRDEEGNYLSSYSPGRIQYNYKTDGSRDYLVELVKHTPNYGGFFNLNETVDNNDVINIYYPDGTPVVENLELGDLKNKWLAQQLTNWTAGKKDKDIGKRVTINMDLKGEEF